MYMYLYTFNNLLNTSGHSSCVWKSTHICWWPQNEVYNFHVHTCMTQMLYKVTHCAVYISANTRPHQLHWGDWEMGTATMLEIPRYYYMYMYIQYLQPCATYDLGLTFQYYLHSTISNKSVWKSTHICWWPQNEVYNFSCTYTTTCMTHDIDHTHLKKGVTNAMDIVLWRVPWHDEVL